MSTFSPVPLLAVSCVLFSCAAAPARPVPVEKSERALPEPRWLPPEARQLLSTRMQRHGDDMTLLLPSVVLLNHAWAEKLTERIAAEPRLARPGLGDDDSVNARLPPRFFELQDEVRARAKAVAEAARAKDDAKMSAAFGQLTQTCVACHALYVQGEAAPP